MRVEPRPLTSLATAAPSRRGTTRFAPSGADAPSPPSSAGAAAPLASLDAVLALQGGDEASERRRRTLRRGQDLLDRLDRLKAALLSGVVPAAALRDLARLLAEPALPSGDPALDGLIAQIDLRAEIELAKLGRSG